MKRLIFFILACLIALPVEAASVNVRSGVHDRYNRLVFDWTSSVTYTMQQQGGYIQIEFNQAATANFKAALATETPLIRSLAQKTSDKGNLVVTFQIPEQSRVQAFPVGTKIAFDVLKMSAEPIKFSDAPPPPAAAVVKAPETPVETTKPAETTPVPPVPQQQENSVTSGPQKPENLTGQVAPPLKTLADQLAEKPPEVVLDKTEKTALPNVKGTVIRLQPQLLTRLAVFERSGKLWLVLDQAIPNLLPRVEGQQASRFENLRRIDGDKATAFVFDLPGGDVVYSLKHDGMEWQVWINPSEKPYLPAQMAVTLSEDKITLYAGEQPRVIPLKDSQLGDTLWVVPVRIPESRMMQVRRSAGYELLSTLMGAVVIPRSDVLRITTTNDLVVLSSSGDKKIISDKKDRETGSIDPKMPAIFRLSAKDDKDKKQPFEVSRQKLEKKIATAQTPRDKANLNLELARLYLANGFGQEAMGLLSIAAKQVTSLETDITYRALRGTAAALSFDTEQAEAYLTSPEIESHPLSKLWLGYSYAEANRWVNARAAYIESSNSENTLPDILKPRILISKAEAALYSGDIVTAQEILKTLDGIKKLLPNEKAAKDYIHARLLVGAGNGIKSIPMYDALTNSADNLYRAKAELDLVDQELLSRDITPNKAIERLERLRFSWRGDRLEVDILKRLGQLYIDQKKYMDGMALWRQAAGLSRDSEDTDAITRNMQDVFKKLYVDGLSDPLEPLQAVAIFQRFKELTPTGEDGNVAIQRLADRLISVDLLDQADELLQNQLMLHAQGTSALAIGTKLASLRIKNNNPVGALKALDESQSNDEIDPDMDRKRILLRARALTDNNKPEDALALLKDLQTPEALSLKADINWKQRNWSNAVVALQGLVGYYRDNGKTAADGPIGPLVLKMAVALALDNNQKGIELLMAEYGGFMAQTKLANSFTLITKQSRGSSLADIETLKNQVGEVQLFEDFLKNF